MELLWHDGNYVDIIVFINHDDMVTLTFYQGGTWGGMTMV
jgi:hypothetical protein